MIRRKNILLFLLSLQSLLGYGQYTTNHFSATGTSLTSVSPCSNVGFELTDFSDWYAYSGQNDYGITGMDDGITSISNTSTLPNTTKSTSLYGGMLSDNLFLRVGPAYTDPYIPDPTFNGDYSLRLGTTSGSSYKCGMKQRITVTNSNAVFELSYALVMMYDAGHTYNGQPFFRFYLQDADHNMYDCSEILEVAGSMNGAVNAGPPSQGLQDPVYYKDWTTVSINLLDFVDLNDDITIGFEVSSCLGPGHFAYAYIDGQCLANNIVTDSSLHCMDSDITFSHPLTATLPVGDYQWLFYDDSLGTNTPTISSDASPSWIYTAEGGYLVTFSKKNDYNGCFTTVYEELVSVEQCCTDCPTISLEGGERYWVSAWVLVDYPTQQINYDSANVQLNFLQGVIPVSNIKFYPTGEIIDGWQKIVGAFDLPPNTSQMTITLNADPNYDTYFDDIRIHPFNGSMKSYVYDPETYFLTAELDDNNYATFYEYDNEGGLIRIKKETARGIVTIQETRSNTIKD